MTVGAGSCGDNALWLCFFVASLLMSRTIALLFLARIVPSCSDTG